jgi:hypothetical protein
LGISLPVGSHLDASQARRTANQAEDYFATAGRQAGESFSRNVNQGLGRVDTGKARLKAAELQRAYDKAADAAGKLRVEEEKLAAVNAAANSTNAQKITAAERYQKAQRASSRATREFTSDLRDLERAGGSAQQVLSALNSGQDISKLGTSAAKTAMDFGELTASIAAFTGPIGIGALAVGAATVGVGALGMLGGAAAELTGVLGLLPGAAVAAGAAFGTMKIATLGFSDALDSVGKSLQDFHDPKKFAEDQKAFAESIQSLSPNAQQAALAINAMVPAFYNLKNASQDALFAGVGQELNKLANTYLPSIQATLVSIAGSFNQMFKGIGDQLMTPETQKAIQATLANISQAFQNLAPAMAPATKAFAEIAQVSSSFLPGLATALTNATQRFSAFIDEAAKSGQLRQWMQDGIDALKELGRLGPDLKQLFLDFKANGKTAMSDLVTVTHGLITIIDKLGGAYHNVSGEVKAMANLTVASFNLVGSSISAALEPLRALISVNNKLNPLFNLPQIPQFKGYDLPAPGAGINPFTPKVQGNAQAESGAGTPFGPVSQIPGMALATGQKPWWSGVPTYPAAGYDVPGVSDDGKGKKGKLPTVAAGSQDPLSLLQGYAVDAGLYSAAGTVLDNQQKVAQAKSDLNTLEKANVRDEDAIVAKRNELARAQREEHESELRLNEAKQSAVNKSLKGLKDAHGAFSEIGAGLDADLGISKGLSGIADNLVRFFGHLALAPLEGKLASEVDKDPRKGGYGLMGILGAQGAFGSQFTGLTQQQGAGIYPVGASGGRGGAYPGDAALLANVRPGTYSQDAGRDLLKGLSDCSSSIGDLVNIMDGQSTGGQKLTTDNAAQWLPAHGFLPGSGGPGDFRVGLWDGPGNAGHMQATLPGGTPWNWGDNTSAARGGVGGTGAFDPSFTQHFYRPAAGMATGAQDATGALNGLAGAANSATQALAGGGGPGGGWSADWNAMAQKESSGNWGINSGNGFSGGLQFTPNSWAAAGGTQYAPSANMATPYQQALTAEQLLAMQGPGAWPNTFTPGSSGPPVVGGGGMYPGMGMGQGLPFAPLGPVAPGGPGIGLGTAAGLGPAQPGLGAAATLGGGAFNPQNPTQIGGGPGLSGQGSGIGMSSGGMMDMAMGAGAMALDAMAPGAGQAAQTGIKLANRAIQFGGQAAGIGVQGLMDTFLPFGGSELASNNWLTRIVGGFAGAHPTIPNIAGKQAPQQPQQQPGAGDQQGQGGSTTNITVNNQRATEDGTGKDIAWHQSQAAQVPGM